MHVCPACSLHCRDDLFPLLDRLKDADQKFPFKLQEIVRHGQKFAAMFVSPVSSSRAHEVLVKDRAVYPWWGLVLHRLIAHQTCPATMLNL
jgi:hypothetical protein